MLFSYREIKALCRSVCNLTFQKKLTTDGVQGSCGLLKLQGEPPRDTGPEDARDLIDSFETDQVFYKYGNDAHNCTLARHEHVIATHLYEECCHFPNFLRPITYMKNIKVAKAKDGASPFSKVATDKTVNVDLGIFEYLDNFVTLHKFIRTHPAEEVHSVVFQLVIALVVARRRARFVHNDLHTSNVVVKKCDKNLFILYRFDFAGKKRVALVKTRGYYPVIIDYGLSYSSECDGMGLETCDLDKLGIITYKYDAVSDILRLGTILATYNTSPGLSSAVKKVFANVPLRKNTAWENVSRCESNKEPRKILLRSYRTTFDDALDDQFYSLIQRCVVLPIRDRGVTADRDELSRVSEKFFMEWKKIDAWVKFNCNRVLLFREFTDAFRKNASVDSIRVLVQKTLQRTEVDLEAPITDVDWNMLFETFAATVKLVEALLFEATQALDSKRRQKIYSVVGDVEDLLRDVMSTLSEDKTMPSKGDTILVIDDSTKSNITCDAPEGISDPISLFKSITSVAKLI
ncbi:hypothetical protein AV955_gp036 [Diadromus pulchellus ascovirus 4a]|uniref:Complete DpAV4 genome n=1 Tax=Diadromus pulchellus ascovirus 4a TaxID=158683 RepID=F2NYW5_9VIRU|nr:hypothetical protein AV955_gp036 [Diadromus pulchellus ascovirus 4a]CCA61393.1 unnamed protein product [Diadromus pulchellus ascovirus 4a]